MSLLFGKIRLDLRVQFNAKQSSTSKLSLIRHIHYSLLVRVLVLLKYSYIYFNTYGTNYRLTGDRSCWTSNFISKLIYSNGAWTWIASSWSCWTTNELTCCLLTGLVFSSVVLKPERGCSTGIETVCKPVLFILESTHHFQFFSFC